MPDYGEEDEETYFSIQRIWRETPGITWGESREEVRKRKKSLFP
jgi:hypothetical protein